MKFASRYLELGYHVIPLPTRRKAPPPLGWNKFSSARPTIAEVETAWAANPNANIGAATGAGAGVCVVDLDGPIARDWGRKQGLRSPMTVITGREDGGLQLWYRWPEKGSIRNSVSKFAEGVDIRGEGGYGILPPSIHPNGRVYASLNGAFPISQLPPLPVLLVSDSTTTILQSRNQAGWIAEALKEMRNGNIDNTLFRICSRLRADGYSEWDAITLLGHHALSAGATAGHLEDKVKNVWSRYLPNPKDTVTVSKSESIDAFLQDKQEVEWLCEPVIAKKSIGFVAGLPAVQKTWAMIDLAVECAAPSGSWLGLFPVKRSRVLFIDQERFKGETQRRFSAVIAAKGLAAADLKDALFLKCGTTIKLDLEASFQAFRSELLELKPDIVIVDSFATFHGAAENDRTAVQQVLNRIKSLRDEVGCAIVFINHESKMVFQDMETNEKPSAFRMMGSVAIPAAAEFVLVVRKVDEVTSIIHHVKSTLATLSQSVYMTVKDVDGGIAVKGLTHV